MDAGAYAIAAFALMRHTVLALHRRGALDETDVGAVLAGAIKEQAEIGSQDAIGAMLLLTGLEDEWVGTE